MLPLTLDPASVLPVDAAHASLAGRVLVPGLGPCVVALRGDDVIDLTASYPTMRDLCETADPAAALCSKYVLVVHKLMLARHETLTDRPLYRPHPAIACLAYPGL